MDYILALDASCYETLRELAKESRGIESAMIKFTLDVDCGWVAELSRAEFCVLLHLVETLRKRTTLARTMYNLARVQDETFDAYFKGLKRDLERFDLATH